MDIFEKISNNTEVLESIFKHLTLRDQIKLLQCTQKFEIPIVQCIWRCNYKNTLIHEKNYITVQSQKTGEECTISADEFDKFMELTAEYLKSLKIYAGEKTRLHKILYKCHDLVSVSLYCVKLNKNILQQLVHNCRKLESLALNICANLSLQLPTDVPIDISIIGKMKSLKNFHFSSDSVLGYFTAMRMCQELKVKTLSICSTIIYHLPEVGSLRISEAEIFSVKTLKIGCFTDRGSLFHFRRIYLMHFKNLSSLHLILDLCHDYPITINFMESLANECQQLVELTLEHCKLTKYVYTVLPRLTCLSLKECERLTKANLREFLNIPQLEKLTILDTACLEDMSGLAHSSSPTLKTLILETSKNRDLTLAFSNSQNRFKSVSTFKWFHENSNYAHHVTLYESISLMFPNLQELVLESQYINLDDLKYLKSLKILKFYFFDALDWPYLKTLLQPRFLTQLFIGVTKKICRDVQKLTLARNKAGLNSIAACETLTRDMEYLKIPLILFRVDVDFWLKFLQQNTKLKLKIFTYYGVELLKTKFLQRLLHRKLFPAELKFINICGFKIDCKVLKSNVMTTLDKYCIQKDDQGEYYFILQSLTRVATQKN